MHKTNRMPTKKNDRFDEIKHLADLNGINCA
jgi:hypothetical protein